MIRTPAPQTNLHNDLSKALYASLLDRPSSDLAISLCDGLLTKLLHQQTKKLRPKQKTAFGALIADLLQRDPSDHGGWLYRAMRVDSFTGEAIGYKVILPIFKAMDGLMLESVKGRQHFTKSEFTGGEWRVANQQATRFRATDWLIGLFEDQGITKANWSEHFSRDEDATRKAQSKPSVGFVLRGGKPPRATGITKRPSLPINRKDPIVSEMIERIGKLNAFLASHTVEPYGPLVQLQRIFSEGHLADHGWKQGGRLYAPGKGSYQNAKKVDRKAITINGQSTIELDLRASHLSILVGLGHLPSECLASGDPYAIAGIPRPVVKQWVTQTISHGKRNRTWPKDAIANLLKDHGIDVKAEYPIKRTGDAILEKLPLIDMDGASVPVGWGELQFRESEIIMTTMETLAYEHGVPSIPVHDSLIVPASAEALARETMKETFRSSLGVLPSVSGADL